MSIINNIFIDQGTDFTMTVDVQNALGNALDLTGYTLSDRIRKTYGSSNVSQYLLLHIMVQMIEITMTLLNATTTVDAGRYVYGLMITSGSGDKTRVVEGQATGMQELQDNGRYKSKNHNKP